MEFIVLLTCAVMSLVLHTKADCPPPTGLKHVWLDPFTVTVSWEKPNGLQDGSEVKCRYCYMEKGKPESPTGTSIRNFTEACLSEETKSYTWTYEVWTDVTQSCNSSNDSAHAEITFKNQKPRAHVVENFKCVIQRDELNCSWVPVDPSLKLNLSYRICGRFEERLNRSKCNEFYSSGTRTGCRLKADIKEGELCIFVETEAGMSTFKSKLEVPPPKLRVIEEGNKLTLSWDPPEIGEGCDWITNICHKQCSKAEVCRNYTITREQPNSIEMAYDQSCLYEFKSRVRTSRHCRDVSSEFSEILSHGTNKAPDGTHTVVAIIIPILLSICVLLSCYCFRRHSAIICPNIPDPSGLIKDFMMNGNKEQKTTGSVYEPVPEPFEVPTVSPVTETGTLQQNV
ncbi:interleukin-13 receptor subunit alpha-1-like [Notolabrus celidotus]|uniref:interleukin-13 receptor subunit alpha-1-like n=1 Tax=Notolabrus celidotus TaxID=1203425 RepID=UPI00148FA83B|nr:interleukin-13 receptor subunit alpha-1-like [Notolabrus celidotus]